MQALNVHETKTQLSHLLQEIEQHGTSFLICRNGKPVAELVPHQRRSRLERHPVMGQIEINYDPTEPLTPDEWPEDET